MLQQAFHVFQMDTGLQGNIFTRTFGEGCASKLAEKITWFYNLWWLCDNFAVSLIVNREHSVLMIREGDKALTECFLDSNAYSMEEMKIQGSDMKFFNVYWPSEIIQCDGRSVDPTVLEYKMYSGKQQLAYKRPRIQDLALWKDAIQRVTSEAYKLKKGGMGRDCQRVADCCTSIKEMARSASIGGVSDRRA